MGLEALDKPTRKPAPALREGDYVKIGPIIGRVLGTTTVHRISYQYTRVAVVWETKKIDKKTGRLKQSTRMFKFYNHQTVVMVYPEEQAA